MASSQDTPPPKTHEDLTDANMHVVNNNQQGLDVKIYDEHNMGASFKSQTIRPGQIANGYVDAGNWPTQSSFTISFNDSHAMKVEIGTGWYSTDASPSSFADGRVGVVLAPGKPFATGVDFEFYFLAGPGLLPPLVNSFIKANLAALGKYVSVESPSYEFAGVKLQLKSLDLNENAVRYVFGGVSETEPGKYSVNTVIDIDKINVNGHVNYGGEGGDFTIGFKNLSAFCSVDIDSGSDKLSVTVKTLQLSLTEYTITGAIVAVLEVFFPLLADIILETASAYRIAGALNTYVNSAIIDALNKILEKFVPSGQMTTSFSTVVSNGSSSANGSSNIDYRTWMSASSIQAKNLKNICVPGTHDSATYNLSDTLSNIKYDDIAFLWALSDKTAPANGKLPFHFPPTEDNPIYLGKDLYQYVMQKIVNNISKAQNVDIRAQLDGGIRFFDLRVCYDERDGGGFYTQHALRGPKMDDVLNQVKAFLDAHSSSGEFIYLFVSHTNLAKYKSKISDFTSLIRHTIGSNSVFWKASPDDNSPFDFQQLGNVTLKSITGNGPKVMIVNGDSDVHFPNSDQIVTNSAGPNARPFQGGYHSIDEMKKNEGDALMNNTSPMYLVAWALAQNIPDITQIVLGLLSGKNNWMLQDYAEKANAALSSFIKQYSNPFQAVAVDWFKDSNSGTNPAELVVGLNYS